MPFLTIPGDDELEPDAREAAQRFLAVHPGPLLTLDRALLGSAAAFAAYRSWSGLREELIPFLGERAVTLFSFAISDAYPAPYCAELFRRELIESGDDPLDPQVTEAERLLIDWGRTIGAGPSAAKPELNERVKATFSPKLRVLLTAYAGLTIANCVVATVAELTPEG